MSPESALIPAIGPVHVARVSDEEGGDRIPYPRAMEARFRPALAAIYHEMYAREDVVALLCFGSAQRGDARPGSDLDLRALTSGNERWMESRVVAGVEVQLKVGSLRGCRGMVTRQNAAILNSFATGELVFDKTGEATELKRFAEERWRAGPRVPDAATVQGVRYGLTNLIRDLEEMTEESVDARMLAGMAVVESIRSWCMCKAFWENPKPSVMLRNVRSRDPLLAAKVERFYAAPSSALAIDAVDAVLEALGGRLYQIAMTPEPA